MGKKAEIGKKLAAARQTFDEYASPSPEGSKFLDKILGDTKAEGKIMDTIRLLQASPYSLRKRTASCTIRTSLSFQRGDKNART